MYGHFHTGYQRLLIDERHEALRRAAGASRLRRELRGQRRRFRPRAGPRH